MLLGRGLRENIIKVTAVQILIQTKNEYSAHFQPLRSSHQQDTEIFLTVSEENDF